MSDGLEIVRPSAPLFVIRRFMRELKKHVGVTVAWTTSTRFTVANEDDPTTLQLDPFEDPETAKAVVPAIGLIGPTLEHDVTDYNGHPVLVPTSYTDPDGQKRQGYYERRAPDIINIRFHVHIFHERQALLWNLHELWRQYLVRNPYLVIPADRSDVEGATIADHALFIQNSMGVDPVDQTRDGYIVEQHIPIDHPQTSSTSTSNDDNLYVATTEVVLQNVQVPDDEACTIVTDLQSVEFDYFSLDDPVQVPRMEIVDEAE